MHTKETPRSGLLSVVLPAYNEEAPSPWPPAPSTPSWSRRTSPTS